MKTQKKTNRIRLLLVALLCAAITPTAFGQNSASFEKELKAKMDDFFAAPDATNKGFKQRELGPNDAAGSLMVPTGFGGSGLAVFGGIGGVYPQSYTNTTDLGASVGVAIGNPFKFVNVALILGIGDVSEFNNYNGNLVLSKRIFTGSSISGGALNLFASGVHSDFTKTTYFLAFSHAVQSLPSKTPGSSKLTYGIGFGNGAFYNKSPLDIQKGKGKYGTGVFANISYEIFHHVNLNLEWTGLNLGISTAVRPFKAPLSLGLGIGNLTNYSSDGANMVFSVGYPLSLTK